MRFWPASAVAAAAVVLWAQEAVWLDVPYVRQDPQGCGAAAIWMVARYWQKPAEVDDIFKTLYSPRDRGIRNSKLVAWFRENGFQVFEFHGKWKDLDEHLRKGRPLILAVRSGAGAHYLVAAGIDPQGQALLVNDPARRKLLRLDRGELERTWLDGWTLLAVPQQP